ncbi:phosphatase PAP2 family protein [Flavobacterium aquidurense]|uniref:phosphatase PAP2 family protein n=1 Tax=Flavobacterium aquidurense TaxID=362413 RepID=UPI0037100816
MKKIAALLHLQFCQSLIGNLQTVMFKNSSNPAKNIQFNLQSMEITNALSLESVCPDEAEIKKININVIDNYSKLTLSLFFLPLLLLTSIVLFLYYHNALSVHGYIEIQKNSFLFLNSKLSHFPSFEYNLTQLGDALIFLSFLSLFIVYAPKIWESLLLALLVSSISCSLKKMFAVPRPAVMFNNNSFVIVGKTLCGNNSLPSGHSTVIFTMLTVLLFALMPKKRSHKFIWIFSTIIGGLIFASSRIGVGAHYPLDVIIGCIIGYISALLGIFISRKYKILNWIGNKKYYPFFIILLLVFTVLTIGRIINENLIIYYLSLISLLISLYKITTIYVKK